jgi:hypothetical protein
MAPTLQISLPGEDGGPLQVTVRELTVAEIRAWATEDAANAIAPGGYWRDPIHATAFEGLGLDELARFCDWPVESFERFTPSELQPVLDAAKGLNPHFFRLQAAVNGKASRLTHSAPPANSIAPLPD